MDPLTGIWVALVAAALGGELVSYLRIPRIVGQIGAGMMVGAIPLHSLALDSGSKELLSHFAEIGIILLLFFTGLKINFRLFAKNFATASSISLGKTTLPLIAGVLISYYAFGLSPAVSLIIGISLSVSAIALGLDILEEFKLLKTRFGSLVISGGAVDDVYGLVLITIAIAFIESTATKSTLLSLAGNTALFGAAVIAFRFIVVPLILSIIEKNTEVTLLMSGFIITMLMATLSRALGLGMLIGALASGMIIRQTLRADITHHRVWEEADITRIIHTIAFGFFVPLFAFNTGLLTDIGSIKENFLLSITLTVIATAGTVIGSAIVYKVSRKNWHEGFLMGWALNSKGDTEIAIATLALGAGIITQSIFSSLIFMAVVSTLISPIVFRYLLTKAPTFIIGKKFARRIT